MKTARKTDTEFDRFEDLGRRLEREDRNRRGFGRTRDGWTEVQRRRADRKERLRQHLLFVDGPHALDLDSLMDDLDAGITAWPQGFDPGFVYVDGREWR